MSVSVLEQVKIQAQVLVPLVKALQAEFGEEHANALVRKALRDLYRRYGEEFWQAKNEENLGKAMTSAFATFARDGALDYEVKGAVTRRVRPGGHRMPLRRVLQSVGRAGARIPAGLQRRLSYGRGIWP